MKKIICTLICLSIVIGIFANIPAVAKTSDEIVFDSPEEMASYVLDNLDAFSQEYNQTVVLTSTTTEKHFFTPNYCEKQFSVQLIDSQEHAICIDLDSNNGYIVVSKDAILNISPNGNLNYLNDYCGTIYFSTAENDFAYYENDEYVFFNTSLNNNSHPSSASYDGTQSNGVITQPYTYLNSRYGEVVLDDSEYLPAYYCTRFTQHQCSVYTRNGISEGNCSLVAMLTALTYFKNSGSLNNLPASTDTSTVTPSNDYFFQAAVSNGYIISQTTVPALYFQLRQLAISSYGYTVRNGKQPDGSQNSSSINNSNTPTILETVCSYYGHDINARQRLANIPNIKSQIKDGNPIIWYTTNDSVYGDHAVVITGYSVYKTYSKVLGVQVCTNTITMICIADGWNNMLVYYDWESANGSFITFG